MHGVASVRSVEIQEVVVHQEASLALEESPGAYLA